MPCKSRLPARNGYIKVFALTFLCGPIAGAAIPAHAQATGPKESEQITIEASPYTIHRSPAPHRQYRLLVPERVSVSRSVSYADLTLSKPADAAEFRRRIEETARQVCEELDRRVPRSAFDIVLDRDCVRTTTEQAMVSARRVMAGLG